MELMKNIMDIYAISGEEKRVKNFLKEQIKDAQIIEDNLGGIAFKLSKGTSNKNILILAHMDEVGFMLKRIEDNGIMKVLAVGSILPEVAFSQRVILVNEEQKQFEGVILGKSPHGNVSSKVEIEELELDFGFENKEQVIEAGIQLGDMITFKNDFVKMQNNRIVTKSADNRLGCLALIELYNHFKDADFDGNIILGASVQEEVGLRGASPMVYALEEDIDNALIIDVSPVQDTVKVENGALGDGTLVRVKDPRCILDYEEVNKLRKIAKEKEIKYQEFFSKGGTDAAQVQITKKGIKTAALCVPARNLHSNNTVFDLNDYKATVNLAKEYIKILV